MMPDLTLILDMDADEGLRRASTVHKETPPGEMDRIESAGVAFHRRVREGYLTIAQREPKRCVIVDGNGPINEVADRVRAAVAARLRL
jgi:dTMP kinase